MGFESSFTLYRKYAEKATAAEMKAIVKKYMLDNKHNDYSEKKKTDEEYAKDLPLILDPSFGNKINKYNEKTGEWIDTRDKTIVGQRKGANFILASDGSHLDELLSWNFISNFTCLSDKFNLGYKHNGNEAIIDKCTAEKILQACNYLLGGKWSDDVEEILDNKWIKILAEGNHGDEYWPYVYRNDKKSLNSIPEDDRYSLEYALKDTRRAMDTFLNADTYGKYDYQTELMLVYSISV